MIQAGTIIFFNHIPFWLVFTGAIIYILGNYTNMGRFGHSKQWFFSVPCTSIVIQKNFLCVNIHSSIIKLDSTLTDVYTKFLKTVRSLYDELKQPFAKLIYLHLKSIFFTIVKNLVMRKIPFSKLIMRNHYLFFNIIKTANFFYENKSYFLFYLHKLEKKVQSLTIYQICTFLFFGYLLAMGFLIISEQLFEYYISFGKLTEVYLEIILGPLLKMFFPFSNHQGGNGFGSNNMGSSGGGGGGDYDLWFQTFFASNAGRKYSQQNKDDYVIWCNQGFGGLNESQVQQKAGALLHEVQERLRDDRRFEEESHLNVVKEIKKIPGYPREDCTRSMITWYMTDFKGSHSSELVNAYKIWKMEDTRLKLDRDLYSTATKLISNINKGRSGGL